MWETRSLQSLVFWSIADRLHFLVQINLFMCQCKRRKKDFLGLRTSILRDSKLTRKRIFHASKNTITFFLVGVASVALLVGGIGVMNIMMIVLSSRVREVGLRKAVGARPRDIMTQFLAESVFITFIGGIIGFVLGVLLTYGIALIAQAMGFEWQFVVTLQAGLIAFGVTIFIGIIFGMYPARKAAKISPMEALRYE